MVRAEIEVSQWLGRLITPDSASLLLERLVSPFQASGKQSLFIKGTELIRAATKRVALVAKTPIVLVGCRPYDESDLPISYESEQLETYRTLTRKCLSENRLEFACVAARGAMVEALRKYESTGLSGRVRENVQQFYADEQDSRARVRLRWYEGSAPMTFLVADDDFIIWFKDSSGESVWITAHNEVIARALYSRVEVIGRAMSLEDALPDFANKA